MCQNINLRIHGFRYAKIFVNFFSFFFFIKADLIWNETTREEFRRSLENEIHILEQEKELTLSDTPIAWNHTEFQVVFLHFFQQLI